MALRQPNSGRGNGQLVSACIACDCRRKYQLPSTWGEDRVGIFIWKIGKWLCEA